MHKILIIDDELPVRFSLKMILKGITGLNIDEAHNGKEGLEKIQEKKYDLVFLDIKMPIMDGDQVVRELQKLPDKPKVILVSAYTHTPVGKEIAEYVQGVISKPFSVEEIRDVLKEQLANEHK